MRMQPIYPMHVDGCMKSSSGGSGMFAATPIISICMCHKASYTWTGIDTNCDPNAVLVVIIRAIIIKLRLLSKASIGELTTSATDHDLDLLSLT